MPQTEQDTNNNPNILETELPKKQSDVKDRCAWYVLKVLWRQEYKTEQRLVEAGIETYIPKRQILKEDRQHRKQRLLIPAINGLVFVHSTIHRLEQVKADFMTRYAQILYFYTNRENGRNIITSIPDAQMQQFRSACDLAGESIQYFLPDELALQKGTRVRICGGAFEGYEGVLLKIKGKRSKCLVVSLEGFISAAVTEISQDFIEVIK